jgi:glucose uptake protein
LVLCLSLMLIITGVLMIIFSKGVARGKASGPSAFWGLGCAVAAGVLWAAYYLPIKISDTSMWLAAFPLACGMLVGCVTIVLVCRSPVGLSTGGAYIRAACSGALWSFGNYGMLLLVAALGAGKGFTISQLAVVVNSICGIYVLKDPPPGTRAAGLALFGCVIATAGAIILGGLR